MGEDGQPIVWGDEETRLSLEPSPRSVTALVAGEAVAGTKRALVLRESGRKPVYCFPLEDVRTDLLEESGHETGCRHRGRATSLTLVTGSRRLANAALTYPEPPEGGPDLSRYVVFDWDAIDEWREEDDVLVGGLRDPYHRVDAVWSERSVRIVLGGSMIAETERPCLVFETDTPTRYYLSPADVRPGLLTPSPSRTECPYKGVASYWSATVGDRTVKDVAWSYEDPLPTLPKIAGLLSFWPDRVDAIEVDGVRLPPTP